MKKNARYNHRKPSFERRQGRMTVGQKRAYDEFWPQFGVTLAETQLDLSAIFSNHAPCILEIGFGTGQSLLELAKNTPERNFIGVDVYKSGISILLLGIANYHLTNLRVVEANVINLLTTNMMDNSLHGVQIFFPDPWPKRRQQDRRLIQPDFIQ